MRNAERGARNRPIPRSALRIPHSLGAGADAAADADVLGGVGEEGDVAGALQRGREGALVAGAGARLAPRLDLAALGEEAAQLAHIFIVDVVLLLDTEDTN